MQGIYKITNKVNGYYYLGSSVNTEERKRVHWWALRNSRHENLKLQRAWNKYGEESFEFSVVEVFVGDYKGLLLLEDEHLVKLPATSYNLRKSSYKKSPYGASTRKKISDGVKRHWRLRGKAHAKSLKKFRSKPEYKSKMKAACLEAWSDDATRRANASKCKVGLKNPAADHTTYTFLHRNGESFVGFRCDFQRLHPELNGAGVKKILDGKWTHYKGWAVTSRIGA